MEVREQIEENLVNINVIVTTYGMAKRKEDNKFIRRLKPIVSTFRSSRYYDFRSNSEINDDRFAFMTRVTSSRTASLPDILSLCEFLPDFDCFSQGLHYRIICVNWHLYLALFFLLSFASIVKILNIFSVTKHERLMNHTPLCSRHSG